MGRRSKFGRKLNGVLIVDKPAGASSNAVLQRAKRLFFANKAGHSGSLDPLATGVLPVCFGEATKFAQFLLDADKEYLATFRLGVTTDTADSQGQVLAEQDAAQVREKDVLAAMKEFRGEILQVPPMYSALKRNGTLLYELARQGIEVEREARPVTIYSYELLAFRAGKIAEVDCRVRCSKGTYIRSLAEELGAKLGVGGHVSGLRRSMAGPFTLEHARDLDELERVRGDQQAEVLDEFLLPVDAPVKVLNEIVLPSSSAWYFTQGQAVMDAQVFRLGDEGDMLRVFEEGGDFLGLGEITDEGSVAPKRLIAQ